MARGKHATQAARQRYEAAMEVIDRLTDQTSEFKMRAKAKESDAAKVPRLEREIADLRRQLDDGCSHELTREREEHDRECERLIAIIEQQRDDIKELFELNNKIKGWTLPTIVCEHFSDWERVIDVAGKGLNRASRRAQLLHATAMDKGQFNVQDNRRTLHDNCTSGVEEGRPFRSARALIKGVSA